MTITLVNTNRPPALNARPPLFLVSDKSSNARFFDILEIFNHAHAVFGSISFIQMFQVATGELITFKTIFRFSVFESDTVFDFALGPCNRFMRVITSATGTLIFFSQIGHANGTIHAARCNECSPG